MVNMNKLIIQFIIYHVFAHDFLRSRRPNMFNREFQQRFSIANPQNSVGLLRHYNCWPSPTPLGLLVKENLFPGKENLFLKSGMSQNGPTVPIRVIQLDPTQTRSFSNTGLNNEFATRTNMIMNSQLMRGIQHRMGY